MRRLVIWQLFNTNTDMRDSEVIGTAGQIQILKGKEIKNEKKINHLRILELVQATPDRTIPPGCFYNLPVLSGEGVNNLLLHTLLASDLEALVLAYSHYLTSESNHICHIDHFSSFATVPLRNCKPL